MIEDNAKPGSTVGGDKNYDTADFVTGCRKRGCTPHVSQNDTNRRSAIDARTTRHPVRCSADSGHVVALPRAAGRGQRRSFKPARMLSS
jgi:hypothetical protein